MRAGARFAFVSAIVLAFPDRTLVAEGEDVKPLDAITVPEEKSSSPKITEWTTALRVKPTREALAPGETCRLDVVREWLRVKCSGAAFAVSMLGGDLDGIAYWIDPVTKEGEVLLPLRRGGRHAFQLWRAGKDKSGAFVPEPTVIVQQYWLDGARAPVVTLHGWSPTG